MGLFSTKTTTYDPLSAYSPEQRKSVLALQQLASTGTGGGLTLGQGYEGDLGYYQQTAGEQQALGQLQGLFGGQDITQARNTFSDLANTQFDPSDPKSGYAAFSRALAKAGAESSDVLNREAAISGNRFGTAIAGEKAGLAEDLANQRGQYLAQLYQQGRQQQLAGAQGLQGLVGTQANLAGQLQEQAQIERLIKDQQAKDQLTEFKRARGEELRRLGLMQGEVNNPMGEITTKSPSTFMKMSGEVMPLVGSHNTHKYGYTTNQTSLQDAMKIATSAASGGMSGGMSILSGLTGGLSGLFSQGSGGGAAPGINTAPNQFRPEVASQAPSFTYRRTL